MTKACPLRCAHCSVSADPKLAHTTFTAEFGERVSAQMEELGAAGIRFIDFTGGEPTLAARFVRSVSRAAKQNGMSTGIVTAAHWASSEAQAVRFIERFPDVDNWDISTDVYHLDFVPLQNVKQAYTLLSERGKTPLIRIAYHEVPDDSLTVDDALLIEEVLAFAGKRIAFQPVGPVGRAENLFQLRPATWESYDRTSCPSTGPLIQPFGHVAPCCAPLSHEEYDHPLRLGNAFTEPLVEIVHRWRVHPLLQTIRLWGFAPVLEWLAGERASADVLRDRACHLCVELIRNRALCKLAACRANEFGHRIRVAYGLIEVFGEHWMDEQLQREARSEMAPPPGYVAAEGQ